MSELYSYILQELQNEYHCIGELSCTEMNTLTLYETLSGRSKLVLIRSKNRNDEVFRRLKGLKTNGRLPAIYEVASEEEDLIVLEEYIEGKTLDEFICANMSFHKATVKQILLDLCTALEILHANGIIHRDIKPENVMIHNNHACLIDLSIAKIINEEKSDDTQCLGTVGYAAPEQYGITGSRPTTDIYAFGVLANELALGVHPTIETPKGRLGRIIKRCTQTQIAKRYQTISEVKTAITKI